MLIEELPQHGPGDPGVLIQKSVSPAGQIHHSAVIDQIGRPGALLPQVVFGFNTSIGTLSAGIFFHSG